MKCQPKGAGIWESCSHSMPDMDPGNGEIPGLDGTGAQDGRAGVLRQGSQR